MELSQQLFLYLVKQTSDLRAVLPCRESLASLFYRCGVVHNITGQDVKKLFLVMLKHTSAPELGHFYIFPKYISISVFTLVYLILLL